MASSQALAEVPPAAVPDLVRTPAMEIDSDDIALPRLYVGQYMSSHVQSQAVKAGCLFVATGEDDPDPEVLYDPDAAVKKGKEPGVLVHILSLRKAKSYSEAPGAPLQLYAFNDPSAPEEAWTTYNYIAFLPEYDETMPVKWLLTRTGRPTAQAMNTVIKKNEARGPAWINAFRIVTAMKENNKGKFFVARARLVEANAANVTAASELAALVTSAPVASKFESSGEEPAI